MRSLERQTRCQGGISNPKMQQGARVRCLNMGNANSKSSSTWFGVTQQLTKLVSSIKINARTWTSSTWSINSMLFSIQIQLNRSIMLINLGIEFSKPRHAKDHGVVQLRNHTKFNSYWSSIRFKLNKKNGNMWWDNTRFISKYDL